MTYKRIFEEQQFSIDELNEIRAANKQPMTDDRLRCQHCSGFYWRLWADQVQCLACQAYTIIEVGEVLEAQLEFDFVKHNGLQYPHNLTAVQWVREQLTTSQGKVEIKRKIKDPVSGRTEFIIFKDRLKCRITGTEILIKPEISYYWIVKNIPQVKEKIITNLEALEIVKRSKREEMHVRERQQKENSSRDREVFPQ